MRPFIAIALVVIAIAIGVSIPYMLPDDAAPAADNPQIIEEPSLSLAAAEATSTDVVTAARHQSLYYHDCFGSLLTFYPLGLPQMEKNSFPSMEERVFGNWRT